MANGIKTLAIPAALTGVVSGTSVAKENPSQVGEQVDGVKHKTGMLLAQADTQSKLGVLGSEVQKSLIFEGTKFDEYYSDIKEKFGDDIANVYKENAEYFLNIVNKGDNEYILKYFTAIFNNPGKEKTFNRFEQKLEKCLAQGKKIDPTKISLVDEVTKKMGIVLEEKLSKQQIAIAFQDEINKKNTEKLLELLNQLEQYEKELSDSEKELELLKEKVRQIKLQIEQIKKSTEKVKSVVG